ncbi:hypothetical protein BH23ACT11_BH23ACT11_18710 [soil metagenome]
MPEVPYDSNSAEIRIPSEDARRIASLLRYAVSLNTTAGLVSPTERRLATPTYKAAELAALVLEGKPFDQALEEANSTWTGSLQKDHERAMDLLEKNREFLRQTMTGQMTPEQLTEFLEVTQDQFQELTRFPAPPRAAKQEPSA